MLLWLERHPLRRSRQGANTPLGVYPFFTPWILLEAVDNKGSTSVAGIVGSGVTAAVLLVTLVSVVAGTFAFASVVLVRARDRRCLRARELAAEKIVRYNGPEEPKSPEMISRHIVERCRQIRRALLENPSDIEVEMCALGYRRCADDLIVLSTLVKEELAGSGPVRRLRLKVARRRAIDALSGARMLLPPDALRTPPRRRA